MQINAIRLTNPNRAHRHWPIEAPTITIFFNQNEDYFLREMIGILIPPPPTPIMLLSTVLSLEQWLWVDTTCRLLDVFPTRALPSQSPPLRLWLAPTESTDHHTCASFPPICLSLAATQFCIASFPSPRKVCATPHQSSKPLKSLLHSFWIGSANDVFFGLFLCGQSLSTEAVNQSLLFRVSQSLCTLLFTSCFNFRRNCCWLLVAIWKLGSCCCRF
jgi:hypothetical protein